MLISTLLCTPPRRLSQPFRGEGEGVWVRGLADLVYTDVDALEATTTSVFPVLLDYKLSRKSRFTVTYSYRVQRRMMWGSVLVFKSEFRKRLPRDDRTS